MEQCITTRDTDRSKAEIDTPMSDYSATTAEAIARRISTHQASGMGSRRQLRSTQAVRLTWAMIERGVPNHGSANSSCERIAGAPFLGFFTAAGASMLLWGAALMLTLRFV